MLGWRDDRPLETVLDTKDASKLAKHMGMHTCGELLSHFPRDYVRHNQDVGLAGAAEGDVVTVTGIAMGISKTPTRNGVMYKLTIDSGVTATFFNTSWITKVLRPGLRVMLSGKLKYFRNTPQLQHPDFVVIDSSSASTGSLKSLSQFGDLDEMLLKRDWIPVYPATAKVSSWYLMGAIHKVLAHTPPIPEPLDTKMLVSMDDAIRQVHEPGPAGPERAIHRLKYNEALSIGLVMALRKKDAQSYSAPILAPQEGKAQQRFLDGLPFELTEGQKTVMGEISQDLQRQLPMMRLLQGEVGSGKTMVAAHAMLQAVDSGKQAALLAPTEVLAAQHAASLSASMPEGVTVAMLTSGMPTAEKRSALLDIVSGEADIVIGTHAIIQETVEFFDLGLVVVDEQHRFGVEQRDSLRAKAREGTSPHVLVMTATPIPRTIAMTVFGDLATSTLRELPGGRKPIQSSVVPEWKPQWVSRALDRIREEVHAGHQVYIVCPRIEGEGGVGEFAAQLAAGPLSGLRVGTLHGRMRDKDAVMEAFAAGEIQVLVATTVIEVGVDVPNATVMLIRESENFGVSQLHQLRGRVGRGGARSLCLFHTLADENSDSFQRISEIAATTSGFDLAELDLAQRQEGDILGSVQSGTKRTLRLLHLARDRDIIERTHADAYALVERNPDLARELTADVGERAQEYLEKN